MPVFAPKKARFEYLDCICMALVLAGCEFLPMASEIIILLKHSYDLVDFLMANIKYPRLL